MEFHEDLFPDTAGCIPASDPHAWWVGSNQQVGALTLALQLGWPLPASTCPTHDPTVQLYELSCPVSPSLSLSPAWDTTFFSQVQKVSLHPARRPHLSFTSCLVPPAEPSPDQAQPADTPAGDADPSVSARAVFLSSPSCHHPGA